MTLGEALPSPHQLSHGPVGLQPHHYLAIPTCSVQKTQISASSSLYPLAIGDHSTTHAGLAGGIEKLEHTSTTVTCDSESHNLIIYVWRYRGTRSTSYHYTMDALTIVWNRDSPWALMLKQLTESGKMSLTRTSNKRSQGPQPSADAVALHH